MNNSDYIGNLDTNNKDDIVAMEDALKAKYENKNSNKPTEPSHKKAESA